MALARLTPAQAGDSGIGPGGGSLGVRSVGDGRIATILVRPLLPGDDRPGAFGLATGQRRSHGRAGAPRPEPAGGFGSVGQVTSPCSIAAMPCTSSMVLSKAPGTTGTRCTLRGPDTPDGLLLPQRPGRTGSSRRPCPARSGRARTRSWAKLPYELMHLACFSGVEFSGTYRLAPYEQGEFELTCPDDWSGSSSPNGSMRRCHAHTSSGRKRPTPADMTCRPAGSSIPRSPRCHPASSNPRPRASSSRSQDNSTTRIPAVVRVTLATTRRSGAFVRLMCRTTFVITEMRPAD